MRIATRPVVLRRNSALSVTNVLLNNKKVSVYSLATLVLNGQGSTQGKPGHGALTLIGKRVLTGEAARLPELEDEFASTLLAQS